MAERIDLLERRRRAESFGVAPFRIVTVNDPDRAVLRQKARPIRHVNRRVRELLDRLAATMYAADGVGLAAPQVGISLRAIVVDTGEGLYQLVNPEIVHAEGEELGWEGCLSIPGFMGEVPRAASVRIRGLDREGRESWVDASGYLARAFQHEIDHLDGILFPDRARRVVEVTPESKLDVVFFGTPGFARAVLEDLLEAGITPVAVVTRPDRPRGRGQRPSPSPVRELALAHDLTVLTPASPREEALAEALRQLKPDVIVTVAYGGILPPELLALPSLGAINLHASLLPKYRGPAPIARALWNGETTTGVTTQYMAEEVDAGDIILQKEVPIAPDDTAGTLSARLAREGAALLRETLRLLAEGRAPRRPQDHALATYAPRIRPEEEIIDWSQPAAKVLGQIRALSPQPGARTRFRDGLLKILNGRLEDGGGGTPGEIVAVEPGRGFAVGAGDGAVWITQVQPAGKRIMTAADFVNGYRPRVGERLASP